MIASSGFVTLRHKGVANAMMTPLSPRFRSRFSLRNMSRSDLGLSTNRSDRDLAGRRNRLRKIGNGPALGISQRDKMPLAAVSSSRNNVSCSHVHIRHTVRSPGMPRFAVVDARLGGHGDELGVSQFTSFVAGTRRHNRVNHEKGVLAQLVERLNGIEEVRGSNPLGSSDL